MCRGAGGIGLRLSGTRCDLALQAENLWLEKNAQVTAWLNGGHVGSWPGMTARGFLDESQKG